jgi:hypothetical protein
VHNQSRQILANNTAVDAPAAARRAGDDAPAMFCIDPAF